MLKLTTILREVITEANLGKDVNKEKQAENYINQIKSFIAEYTSDNKRIHVIEQGGYIIIQTFFPGIDIWITNISSHGETANFKKGLNGHDSLIKIYNAQIETKPKMSAKFDENSLRHELVHYFDYKNIKDPQTLSKKVQGNFKDDDGNLKNQDSANNKYLNHGTELNAHFFELFMPQVMKYVEKQGELPPNVNDFVRDVIRDGETKRVFNQLNPVNKQKVMKRLGTYYDTLKNGVLDPGGQVDDKRLKDATSSWMSNIKKIFGFK